MCLKKLIEAERMQSGRDFLADCDRLGLSRDDIKKAEKGIVENGKEYSLSELLKVPPERIINLSREG